MCVQHAAARATGRAGGARPTVRASKMDRATSPTLTYSLHRHVTRDSVSPQTKTTVRTGGSRGAGRCRARLCRHLGVCDWQSSGPDRPVPPHPIEVIDGDTVRFNSAVYRLVGFDTPERGDKARAATMNAARAETATTRLRALIAGGDAHLTRVVCACRPGLEGTPKCNFGRLCGSLSVGGRDAGNILISEGLAHSYICGATKCPQRPPWYDGG
jgi:endonuclease YncB( thermonuclease family)